MSIAQIVRAILLAKAIATSIRGFRDMIFASHEPSGTALRPIQLTEEADERFIDLRNESNDPRRQFDRTLRLRRLGKLEQMGLATEHAPGVWELSERMEPTLRELGERGDIIRNMHKALKADGLQRDPMTFQLHDAAPETPIVGRVVDKYLTDEMGENLTVVVDGIDGRTHHVPGIDPADTASRPSDHAIAAIAEDGTYRPSRHLEQAKFEGRVPGGDYEGYVDAHIRRLEALRRAGIVERIDADCSAAIMMRKQRQSR